MSKSTWTGAVSHDWADADNWSPAGVPGAGSDVTIATGDAVASASIDTVNSITDSSDLSFESAGTNAVTTFLDNAGSLHVDDNAGAGGTILNIGGALTNSHRLTIGNATLSAPDEVTAAALDNKGSIYLTGSSANQALLDVTAGSAGLGAAGTLSGYVRLVGDSAIEFTSGQITSLAAGAHLGLNGSDAFIEDSKALGSNSALTGLASIGASAIFDLENKASVSTTGALVNHGDIQIDSDRGGGGSSLTVAGTLTNSFGLFIGNTTLSASDKVTAASLDNANTISLTGSYSNQYQALLDVTAGSAGFGVAGVLSGDVEVNSDSAIEFTSGRITSVAAGALLDLNGNDAFIEDSTAPGSNSALKGLALIGAGSSFGLQNGAAVSTTGALVNDGKVFLDAGGSSLTVGGTLTNTGTLRMGGSSGLFLSSSKVSTTALTNTGLISLTGTGAAPALLDVSGATTNNGSISIFIGTEELAGAVSGVGSFSLSTANLQFDSSVSSGQTITETGADALTLKEAQNFAAKISGFGTGDTIDATNFLKTATTYDFVENIAGTGGTLTLHDASLTANIQMTGNYSNSDFTLAPDSGTGTLVKSV
jgi:hypothetical protein